MLPEDLFLEIILKSEPDEIKNLCSSSKYYNFLCKHHSEYISRHMLKKNNVDYGNPHSYIYTATGKNYSGTRSFYDIYKLYLKSIIIKAKHEEAIIRSKKWLSKRKNRLEQYSINELIDNYNLAFNKQEVYNPERSLVDAKKRIIERIRYSLK